jgi:hypothetical protein
VVVDDGSGVIVGGGTDVEVGITSVIIGESVFCGEGISDFSD